MKSGDIAFLRIPYKGYRAVELIEKLQYRWLVRIIHLIQFLFNPGKAFHHCSYQSFEYLIIYVRHNSMY